MRPTRFFPVLLAAMAMSLCAGAQQSSNYQLKEHDLNAGGVPKDGLALTSTNFKIAVGTFGEGLWTTGMSSTNFQLVAGFPVTTVPACTLSCTATVPDTGVPGIAVSFASTATPSSCSGSPTFDWDFGDGTTHGTAQNPTHTYAGASSYNWTLTVTVDGITCTKTGTIAMSSSCTLTCTATVPTTGTTGTAVSFASTATPSNCSGSPSFDWDFGDGTTHGTLQNTTHTYAGALSYNWTLTVTVGVMTCTKTGTIAMSSSCTLTCTATVPATGTAGMPVSFASTATPGNCSGSATFDWDFGDGTAHASAQNLTHTYTTAGAFTWTLTVSAGGATCPKTGTITIVPPPVITLMKKVSPPFKIAVNGSNLQNGIKVYIDGTEWTSVVWKKLIKIQLTGAIKTAVPKGVPKTFRFVNPDGGEAIQIWGW